MLFPNSEYINFPNTKANSSFPYLVLEVNHGQMIPGCKRFKIMHYHEDLQLIYVVKGSIEVCSLVKTIELKQGDGLYINRNTIHRITQRDGCHYFCFIFPESFLKFYFAGPASALIEKITLDSRIEFMHFKAKFQEHPPCAEGSDNDTEILKKLSALVCLERQPHNRLYEYEVLVTLSEIALLMLKSRASTKTDTGDTQDQILNTRMQKFLDFIAGNFKEELSLEKLAQSAFVSKSQCLRCFKKALQTTPYKYLNEFRLMKACELLRSSALSIAAIAEAVGFKQQSHFGECFKEKTGVTPRQYRMQKPD